jgi:CRISPR/Cas system-associated protein Cas10 (large subunit of type III CRISPR-Cas system)
MFCNTCKTEKPETEFALKNKVTGKRSSKCKTCHAKYVKKHYKRNKAAYIKRALDDKENQRQKRNELIQSIRKECAHCGENHPAVLDFHHLDPNTKDDHIASIWSRKRIIEEAKKCIVLCSNCHRKLHYELDN